MVMGMLVYREFLDPSRFPWDGISVDWERAWWGAVFGGFTAGVGALLTRSRTQKRP
jgi:hypothetical protein